VDSAFNALQFDPLLLALLGVFASIFVRVILCRIGVADRSLMGENRKRSMDKAD
jgi:hypothetical protein